MIAGGDCRDCAAACSLFAVAQQHLAQWLLVRQCLPQWV
jgi:hypothetical protein